MKGEQEAYLFPLKQHTPDETQGDAAAARRRRPANRIEKKNRSCRDKNNYVPFRTDTNITWKCNVPLAAPCILATVRHASSRSRVGQIPTTPNAYRNPLYIQITITLWAQSSCAQNATGHGMSRTLGTPARVMRSLLLTTMFKKPCNSGSPALAPTT